MDDLLSWLAEAIEREAARPRPVEIWKQPCPNCPSTKGPDPESEDIKTWSKKARIETVFRCALRTEKMCKGYCDEMGVTEEDLREVLGSRGTGDG